MNILALADGAGGAVIAGTDGPPVLAGRGDGAAARDPPRGYADGRVG